MTKDKILGTIGLTIIGLAIFSLLAVAYMLFVPVNVVKPNVQPYKVLTPSIKAGDVVIYQADVCKYKETSSLVSRRFVDESGVRYPIPVQESNVPAGCTKNGVPVATLPSFHPGKWYLVLDVEYQVNPLRKQSYHFTTDVFEITE